MRAILKFRKLFMWIIAFAVISGLGYTSSIEVGQEGKHAVGNIHCQKAEEYLEAQQYDKAIEEYDKSIRLDPDYAWAYKGIIDAYIGNKDFDTAERYMETLIRENPNNACAYYGLGYLYGVRNKWDKSLKLSIRAIEIDPKLPNAHHLKGSICFATGQNEQALEAYEQALLLYQVIDDRKGEAAIIGNMGNMYKRLGDLTKALEYCNKALELNSKLGYKRSEASNLKNIGVIYKHLGDLTKALEYSKKALELNRKIGNKLGEVIDLNNIGLIYRDLGDLVNALKYSSEALKLNRELNDTLGEAINLNNIGIIYWSLGNLTKALECCTNALELNKKLGDKVGEASNLNNIGFIYRDLGDRIKALEYCTKALEGNRELGNRQSETKNLNNIGLIYRDLSALPKALEYCTKALELSRELDNKRSEAISLENIGELYYRLGKLGKAIEYGQKGLSLAERIGYTEVIWSCQNNIGKVYEKQENFDKACEFYKSAIEIIELVREKLKVEKFKTGFMEEKMDVYVNMVRLLVKMGKERKAFDYAERAKARSLLDMLFQAKIDITEGISPELYKKKKSIEKELREVQTTLTKEFSKKKINQKLIDELQAKLEEVKKRHQDLSEEIILKHPSYAALTGVSKPLTVAEVQDRILGDHQVLLEYFIGDEQTFIWVVRKKAVALVKIDVKREELEEMVAQLRKPLTKVDNLADINFDLGLANKLYQRIFQPVEKFLTSKDLLLIVPDGILHYLPFEALVTEVGTKKYNEKLWYSKYGEAKYLVELYPIFYSPSASALDPILQPRKDITKIEGALVAFGNPDYYGISSEARALRGSIGWNFQPLPYSEEEVKTVTNIYKKSKCFVKQEAVEENFKSEVGKFENIHISAHGLLDENMPAYSGLVLTQDEDPTEDGFLQAYEIINLRLNSDLVTLSACETGLGKLKHGEGVIGLTRAFMYAGASSVLVSLWSVNDESTCKVMGAFYKYMKQEGLSKVEALRQAKLKLMKMRKNLGNGNQLSYAHPFFWAPFVGIGDWR